MKNSDLSELHDLLWTLPAEYSIRKMDFDGFPVPVGVSNRHVHLSRNDVDVLFGQGYNLTSYKRLSQPGQFAAQECVTVVGPKGELVRVRVLGPVRHVTQLEILRSDSFFLGIDAPVRESGCLDNSGSALLVGPAGYVYIHSRVISARRHIHMSSQDAEMAGVKNGQTVRVRCDGKRGLIFDEVVIRVGDNFVTEFHIDTEEANAGGLTNGDCVWLLSATG